MLVECTLKPILQYKLVKSNTHRNRRPTNRRLLNIKDVDLLNTRISL